MIFFSILRFSGLSIQKRRFSPSFEANFALKRVQNECNFSTREGQKVSKIGVENQVVSRLKRGDFSPKPGVNWSRKIGIFGAEFRQKGGEKQKEIGDNLAKIRSIFDQLYQNPQPLLPSVLTLRPRRQEEKFRKISVVLSVSQQRKRE